MFGKDSKFTDDTVMTVANVRWLLEKGSLTDIMQDLGRRYPHAGYGGMFKKWLKEEYPQPYNSFGNGAAMRVSPVGWVFGTLEETLDAARESASVTHNHPEGIKGAQATAACIFLARKNHPKEAIKAYIKETFHYNLDRTCDEIRPAFRFDSGVKALFPNLLSHFWKVLITKVLSGWLSR